MYEILASRVLTTNIYEMVVKAPRIAARCLPGQFLIVRMDERGERIPLTICDYDRSAGTVTIVFQIVGASTKRMAELQTGDKVQEDFICSRRSRNCTGLSTGKVVKRAGCGSRRDRRCKNKRPVDLRTGDGSGCRKSVYHHR